MKKFLSLVLALVMTMSLVTVSAGAKDFTDNDKITYDEAVAVMSAAKVIDGYAEGDFRPTNTLTRGAAAKIICNLILGPTTASALVADAAPYKDVPTTNPFAGYIAYCQKEGIISGYADGTFKPANTLTGYAFMKMLLGALGYDSAIEGYTGANWSIAVAKQAINAGLNNSLKGSFNGVKTVTREEACLYAFNTLKATMVEYDTTITIAGVTVAGARQDVVNSAKTETVKDDNKMQFAEKYFTKLTAKADSDAFERPATTWAVGNEKVGTYVDYTQMVAEYTTSVSGKELYDAVGKTAFEDYDFYSYVDGAESDFYKNIAKNNKDDIKTVSGTKISGNGALTQVFVDNDKEKAVVTVINTYLAQAKSDYSSKKDSVSYKLFGATGTVKGDVSGEDFAIENVKEDDFALVTYSYKDEEIKSIDEVKTIADTEIQKFKSGKDGNLTVDGSKYDYSKTATYDPEVLEKYTEEGGKVTNLKDVTYNIYVDQYGYVIGVEEVNAPDNYVFVTGVDQNSSNLTNKTWTANAIFIDGTTKNIEVKDGSKTFSGITEKKLVNSWYTYTVNNSDEYSLTQVKYDKITDKKSLVAQHKDNSTLKIDAKNISLAGNGETVYGNDSTVYLLADMDKVDTTNVIAGVDEVVTGVKNAAFTTKWYGDLGATAYPLYKSNGYVIAAVVVGESSTVASDLAYMISDDISSESYDKSTKTWTWTRDAVIGGEKVELVESNDTGVSVLDTTGLQYAWRTVKYDAKGNVKKLEALTAGKDLFTTVSAAVAAIKADKEDVIVLDTNSNHTYSLKGSTLYDETTGQLGFLVAEDVKVVLKQTVKNKSTTSYDEGVKALETTLENLNGADAKNYDFDAVIENGIAKVVVIVDKTGDNSYVGPNGSTTGAIDKVTLSKSSEGKGNIDMFDKKGNHVTEGTYSFELWQYAQGQDTYVKVEEGTYTYGKTPAFAMSANCSYYVVVDGVESNIVRA